MKKTSNCLANINNGTSEFILKDDKSRKVAFITRPPTPELPKLAEQLPQLSSLYEPDFSDFFRYSEEHCYSSLFPIETLPPLTPFSLDLAVSWPKSQHEKTTSPCNQQSAQSTSEILKNGQKSQNSLYEPELLTIESEFQEPVPQLLEVDIPTSQLVNVEPPRTTKKKTTRNCKKKRSVIRQSNSSEKKRAKRSGEEGISSKSQPVTEIPEELQGVRRFEQPQQKEPGRFKFGQRDLYDLPSEEGEPEIHVCNFCYRQCYNSLGLERHLAIYHGEGGPRSLKCPLCFIPFKYPAYLAKHIRSAHPDTQGVKNKDFVSIQTLNEEIIQPISDVSLPHTASGSDSQELFAQVNYTESDALLFFGGEEGHKFYTSDITKYSKHDPALLFIGQEINSKHPQRVMPKSVKQEPLVSDETEKQTFQIIKEYLAACPICGEGKRLFSSFTTWSRHLKTEHNIETCAKDKLNFEATMSLR